MILASSSFCFANSLRGDDELLLPTLQFDLRAQRIDGRE